MADFRSGRRWTVRPRPPTVRRMVDEEIHPSSGWTNDFPGFHCLLVNLPGFEENDIKLNVDESGIIVVSGRRRADENKQEHFEKTFNVPEDGDVKNITKIFDGATLRVRIPKVAKPPEPSSSVADAFKSTTDMNRKDEEEPKIPPLDSIEEEDGEPVEPETRPASSDGTNKPETEDAKTSCIENKQDEEKTEKPEESQPKKNGDQVKGTELTSSKQDNNTGKPQEIKKEKTDEQDVDSKKPIEQKGGESGSSEQEGKTSKGSVMGKIAENKGILIASLISFTLGLLLSQKIHPSSH